MADGKADATLVAAAYRMGMANVPADTSKTFMRQYEALGKVEVAKLQMQAGIVKGVGDLAETGIKVYTELKIAKRQKERDAAFEESLEKYNGVTQDLVLGSADNWENYKKNGIVADKTSINYQKSKLEAVVGELNSLRKTAKGNPANIAKIAELEKSVTKWRNQTNEMIGDYTVHAGYFANDDVDISSSFQGKDGGFSPLLATLYKDVMDPSVDLAEAGITPQERNGQEGYLFDSKQDRLALSYKMSKASVLGYDPKAKPGLNRYDEGAGYGGKKIKLAKKKNSSWISRDELLSMVKLKDKQLPLDLTDKMTEVLLAMSGDDKKTGQRVDNGDGTFTYDKSKLKYNIGAYSDIEAKSEKEFYDIIMTPKIDGKSRDIKAGIAYLSNNETFLGNTSINYGEMKQKDFNVDIAVINQMGIGSDVITSQQLKKLDTDNSNTIDAAELEKHLGAKKDIFKVLFNPQTKQETEVAAREMAKFFNLQTKTKANSDRGNIMAKGGGGGGGNKVRTGSIDLGVSGVTDARIYAEREDVRIKQDLIMQATDGDIIQGWDGFKTDQYVYTAENGGYWRYQVWDKKLQQFVTKGGNEDSAGGGEGVKHFNTKQVINSLIPQTMRNKTTKGSGTKGMTPGEKIEYYKNK